MSKSFKADYTINVNNVDTLEKLNAAKIAGKMSASNLNADDLSTIFATQIKYAIKKNNADALLIYSDGTCEYITMSELNKMADELVDWLNDNYQIKEKKEPWYKRLWHKIFPKK